MLPTSGERVTSFVGRSRELACCAQRWTGSGAVKAAPCWSRSSLRAREGVSHVQVWLEPSTPNGIDAFARVLEASDSSDRGLIGFVAT